MMTRCAECGRTDGIKFEKGRWLCPECSSLTKDRNFPQKKRKGNYVAT